MIDIVIDGLHVQALVDTGAAVSVIRADLCNRLRKVTTPFVGRPFRAVGEQNIVPTGVCTARIVIQEICYCVEFVVLSSCSHDVILGWDFLEATSALIDCERSEVDFAEIRLPEENDVNDTIKLFLIDDARIPAFSSVLLPIQSTELEVLVLMASPSVVFFRKTGVLVPFSLLNLDNGKGFIMAVNMSSLPIMLPAGEVVAYAEPSQAVEVFSFDTPSPAYCCALVQQQHDEDDFLLSTVDGHLDSSQKDSILSVLRKFNAIFDRPQSTLGRSTSVVHHINTGNEKPLRQRPYRVSASERGIIDGEVNDMIDKGVITPSTSPWASPVVLVKKKDGSIRFCVDYRRLNKITRKDVYPMPRIDDALDSLQGAEYFSSLDLRSGYWQIPMASNDRDKTAFITSEGLYEFNVMPFGLCNAPATFERMMDAVLRGLKWKICLCYLDDVVIFSKTFEEHLQRLTTVLSCLSHAGLQLNAKKCRFAARQIKVLGHLVSKDGIQPDPEKIQAVSNMPKPTTEKELRSFLGLCSYFRRFVRGFASIAAPLHDLLKKSSHPPSWTSQCEAAFNQLKEILTSAPILRHFDPTAPTELRTDASGFGIGAVLAQTKAGCGNYVVAYASRALSKPEKNYTVTEKECLAVVWAVTKFRPYLYGRRFNVVTDHHALCWLSSLKDLTGRLGRWMLRLQEYDFAVLFKSGRKHGDADGLSRCLLHSGAPDPSDTDEDPITLSALSIVDMQLEQARDLWLSKIVTVVRDPDSSPNRSLRRQSKHFRIRNGLLYRRNYSPEGLHWLLVIPRHLRREVLEHLHNDPTCAHGGLLKTYTRVRLRYYWPGLYGSVQKFLRSCPECQRRKPPSHSSQGLLQPIPCPERPFQRVGIDLFGPLPNSSSGNRWTIVAIDHLTRYVETAALPSATAENVANFFLNQIVLRHGAPKELLSDRGTVFLSKIVEEVLRACSVIHRTTSPYHPQTNGMTERFNRTLADMLAMYISPDHRNWDKVLPFITFAYNTAVQNTTQFSPFFLLYGREVSSILDSLLPYSPEQSECIPLTEIREHAEQCRQIARTRTADLQGQQKRRHDAASNPLSFTPGDLVLLWTPQRRPGLCEKLLSNYQGPYRVLRQTSEVNYEIEPLSPPTDRRRRGREIAHVNRLKLYSPPISQP